MVVIVEITEIRKKQIEVEVYPDEECSDIIGLAESKAENRYYLGYLNEDNIENVEFNVLNKELLEC
jgi:hypothetical protein